MPKRIRSKTKIKSEKKIEKNSIWEIFKFGESYTSLILGIVAVVVATILLLTFVKNKNTPVQPELTGGTKQEQNTVTPIISGPEPSKTQNLLTPEQKKPSIAKTEATYTILEGDTLWNIAEKKYNSGYNWTDIQKANKIANPDVLYVGTKLILPNVEPKIATVVKPNNVNQQISGTIQTNKISGSSYTVVKGDTLWDIAVRAYGDGYAWTKISKANNLSNPDKIFSGNKITIPRG